MGSILLQEKGDYNAIRIKLGITTDDLADSDIETVGLLPVGEAMIQDIATSWSSIMAGTGTNKVFLQAATVCICAALAIPLLEIKRSQAFREGDYSESETKANWEMLRASLLKDCGQYLMQLSTATHTRRTLFTATGPTSAGTAWPTMIEQWQARVRPTLLNWLDSGNGQRFFGWENMP